MTALGIIHEKRKAAMTNVHHPHVTDQLRELRDRAGLSMDALARAKPGTYTPPA